MYEPNVQFRVNLFKNPFSNRCPFTVHRMNAKRQSGKAVRLVKKRDRKRERGGDPFKVLRRGAFWQKAVLDARIVPLIKASLIGDLTLTRSPILPRKKQ